MSVTTGEKASRGVEEGEASAPRGHPSWAAVKRHRNAGEDLCKPCREFHRNYYRDYERTRRRSAVERAKLTAAKRRWRDRNAAAVRAYERRRYRQQLAECRAYVDPVVVNRLVRGEPANPTRRERLAAAQVLRNQGASYSVIAAHLGVSQRQVHRDLSDLGMVKAA